ncbi:MAG: hypothetical protein ACTSU5_21650 [Promethearchaeota archaeon]
MDTLFTATGSVFSRKRTALFESVDTSTSPALKYVSDLPSAGDTAYAGVVVEGDRLYVSYYSSDPARDYGWLMGMLLPSDIYFANVSTSSLLRAADDPLVPQRILPWDNYVVVFLNAGFVATVAVFLVRRSAYRR